MDSSLVISMHVKPIDQMSAIKTVKRKLTRLNDEYRSKEGGPRRLRHGHTPSDLSTYGSEAQKLLQGFKAATGVCSCSPSPS